MLAVAVLVVAPDKGKSEMGVIDMAVAGVFTGAGGGRRVKVEVAAPAAMIVAVGVEVVAIVAEVVVEGGSKDILRFKFRAEGVRVPPSPRCITKFWAWASRRSCRS